MLFLRWDFKCLAELREKEETNSKAATPLFGRRLSGDSSTEDAIESAATPSSLAYKHGVLLQDRLPRAQEERLRSSLEDRAFALGALATALNHSLETFATSCSCFFERLALQGPEAAEFGCEENGESSCRDALIRALLTPSPDSPGVLVASFLPALQVDIVTLSNGKRLQASCKGDWQTGRRLFSLPKSREKRRSCVCRGRRRTKASRVQKRCLQPFSSAFLPNSPRRDKPRLPSALHTALSAASASQAKTCEESSPDRLSPATSLTSEPPGLRGKIPETPPRRKAQRPETKTTPFFVRSGICKKARASSTSRQTPPGSA